MALFKKSAPPAEGEAQPAAKEPKAPPQRPGHVKLIGIAGLSKDEEFSIEPGKTASIGRSRDCTFCLRDVPRARDLDDQNPIIEQHFRTVSRKHLDIAYHAPDNVVLTDHSSNGSFLDGTRIEGSVTISDLPKRRRELKLGTHETFALDWWELVNRSKVKMVQVKVLRMPKEEEESKDGKPAKKGDGGDKAK